MPKKRSDSSHVQTEIMADALKGIKPPACVKLEDHHLPFFNFIVEARQQWTNIDLIHAANLARCLHDIEEESELLSGEGSVVWGGKNGTTKVMNPRVTVLEQLSRRAVSVSSKIQVHAAATVGEAKLSKGKNTAKRDALEAMEYTDDDLIARPH